MSAKIRLKKVGRKGQPSYRVVVLDGRKPRDAKVVADLGPYDPKTNPPTFEIDGDAALKWLLEGAKPTRAARNILSNAGVLAAWDAAKRGETVAIKAKELKPDEPKKTPSADSAKSDKEPEAEEKVADEVTEEPAAEEAPAVEESEAETPAEEEVAKAVEEPAAEEPAAQADAEEPAAEAEETPKAEESAGSAESEAEEAPKEEA